METMTARRRADGYEFKRDVLAVPSSVGLLRDLAAVHLGKWGLTGFADDAALLISEIVTNSVNANPGLLIEFEMYVLPDAVMVEVWDPSLDRPRPRTAGEEDISGRGLGIVDFLAEAWGTRWPSRGGKTVWARLARSPADHADAGGGPST